MYNEPRFLMQRFTPIRRTRRQALGGALLIGAASVCAPALAYAHFILMTPDSWMSQDTVGFPEKLGPCGDEGGGTATGKVTAFHAGQTIAVTIDEVVPHPGHYRVALAVNDRSELPAEPMVTPTVHDPCGSAAIQNPPTFPILADNLLPHTQAFGTPQTFTITLPTDVTCTKCTLQVLEFMSSHGTPCFYHHCADISIQGGPDTPTAAPLTPTATITQPVSATSTPTPTPLAICVGDCHGNGGVTVDEIITMVNIALGAAPVDACIAGDTNGDRRVTIDEILTAVNNAMRSCPTP